MSIKLRIYTTEVLMIIDFSNEIVNVHQMSLLKNIQSLNFRPWFFDFLFMISFGLASDEIRGLFDLPKSFEKYSEKKIMGEMEKI